MSRNDCPCTCPPHWGMTWAEWNTIHRDAHLAAFPDVDRQTRQALDDAIRWAEEHAS